MARRSKNTDGVTVDTAHYKHVGEKRKNIPPAKIASEGEVPKVERAVYYYSPHLAPVLRFDPTGESDRLKTLITEAGRRALTTAEQEALTEALRSAEPWLEWANKREQRKLEIDPVALHIHERVSAQAIVRTAMREDVQRDMFADPQQPYQEAVQFYKYEIDWANRLILGDSLQVMASLARREHLAGKVQMIYLDPPYGIKFSSNFQPEVAKRETKEKETDLTREPEMVKAYRDTWTLGVHSYLSYLRDRLAMARELLAETGSIFVQISDENLHRVRCVMDEVFGVEAHIVTIPVKKKGAQKSAMLDPVNDYLLWYGRSPRSSGRTRFNPLYVERELDEDTLAEFRIVEFPDGSQYPVSAVPTKGGAVDYRKAPTRLFEDHPQARVFRPWPVTNGGFRATQMDPIELDGRSISPPDGRCWSFKSKQEEDEVTPMERLRRAARLCAFGKSLDGKRYLSDFAFKTLTNWWDALGGASDPVYVVQTNPEIIARCMLMTTEPGDLVLDPTCGSGSTAYVAEQWGRRWITIDTSRIAVAIARQRLITSRFEHYRTRGNGNGSSSDPRKGFVYKTVPHVTLKDVAHNKHLDPIFEKHDPILESALAQCTKALKQVTAETRERLAEKLAEKQRREGRRAIGEAEQRRWNLPKNRFDHWTVPFDTDADWPKVLKEAVVTYRKAWQSRTEEINASVAANADQEPLVDRPEVTRGVVRVSGPFTVEGVRAEELSLGEEGLFDGTPNEWEDDHAEGPEPKNQIAYLTRMVELLRQDGLTFIGNKTKRFARIEPLFQAGTPSALQAEGCWDEDATSNHVAIGFGPQYGPVSAMQVEELIRASRRYDELVIAGFSFDAEATAAIQEARHPKLIVHQAYIRPDENPAMKGLLKQGPRSQIFSVFGQPEIDIKRTKQGWVCKLVGVDIYDPLENTVRSTGAEKVAAWFLDSDFDGRCFCITQAFFPDKNAWDKIANALKARADEDAFAKLSGTSSIPFETGKHRRIAVKVIDPRGNEVMVIRRLDG